MITELQITNPTRAAVSWWKDVPALRDLKTISFKPGLNILWARNGVGKSTVLQVITNLFCCNQIGRPYVTQVALEEYLYRGLNGVEGQPDGVLPIHDGQAILSFNPDRTPGLLYGGSHFDYDFMSEGLSNMQKVSSGQGTLRQLTQQMGTYVTGKTPWPEIYWKMETKSTYDVLQARIDFLNSVFEPKIPVGPKTLIMDEPEKCLDIDNAEHMWRGIRKWSETHQIIVASHSMFALGIEGANYIELQNPDDTSSYLTSATYAARSMSCLRGSLK